MFKNLSIANRFFLTSVGIIGLSVLLIASLTITVYDNSQQKVVEETSTEINKQIVFNYDNYMESVIDAFYFLQLETLGYTKTNDYETLESMYNSVQTVDRNINAIYLLDLEGLPILTTLRQRTLVEDIKSFSFFENALNDGRIYHFSHPTLQTHIEGSQYNVVTLSRRIQYYNAGEIQEAILAIDLLTEGLTHIANQADLGENGHIIFYDAEGSLVYSTIPCEQECESLTVAKELMLGGGPVRIDSDDYYVHVNTLRYARWTMATYSDINTLYSTRRTMIATILGVLAGTIVLGSVVAKLNAQRISRPLTKLQERMQTIQSHRHFQEVKIVGQKEVVALSTTFNEMGHEIEQLMARVISEQRAKRKTQFVALQNQINPHFLYNTLDSILYLSENNQNEDVQKMVAALSKFFRLSISNESGTVSLEEEIEHIKNYLEIQQIRYHNVFTYSFDIDESLLTREVLKLGLQPIVENAIHHGIDQNAEDNHISVQARQDEYYLIISVENTGYGLTEETIEQLKENLRAPQKTNHIGLQNIYQRLILYFGKDSDLTFESEMDEFTRVSIKIPLKKEGRVR